MEVSLGVDSETFLSQVAIAKRKLSAETSLNDNIIFISLQKSWTVSDSRHLKSVEYSTRMTISSRAGRVFEETPTTYLPMSDSSAQFLSSFQLALWNAG